VSAVVDPQSGELAGEWCPVRTRQWFKQGHEPTEPCQLHTGPPEGQVIVDVNGNVQNPPSRDPISAAARGIGNILRKIIHW